MQLNLKQPTIALESGQVVTLDDAQGTRIVTRVGSVWVTEEGETRDHVIGPGDALVPISWTAWIPARAAALSCPRAMPATKHAPRSAIALPITESPRAASRRRS